ncbi:anti-sigma factor [Bacillus pseudomycoides]|nr:anti-sigma factor [Bacillus pseudomycoides]
MDRQIKKAFYEKVNETSFPQHVNIEQLIHSKKKKMSGWKQYIAITSVVICLVVTMFGLTFSASAVSIPIIRDIFRFLDIERVELHKEVKINEEKGTGLHHEYKKYSNELNLTQESNGIKFTVHDAIYDGQTVSLTYSIESNLDLGDNPVTLEFLKIKGAGGTSESNGIKKVDKHKYVGLLTASTLEATTEDSVNMQWIIDSIKNLDTQKEIKGNWKFDFTLKTAERKEKLIHSSVEQDGVKVFIEKLSISPMSFIVSYKEEVSEYMKNRWDDVYVDLKIKDDLGNSYAGEGNGSIRDESSYILNGSKTFEKINPNATKLIITPHVMLSNHNADNYGVAGGTGSGGSKFSIQKIIGRDKEELVLKDIVIELEK